ncbi:STAS domain-containing protein [Desulfovulcanus sp.]
MPGDEKAVLVVEQDIVSTYVDDLKEKLKSVLADNPSQLVLDLSKVEYVDSIGLGIIIATFNTLKKHDASLKLINLNSNLLELFRTMQLDKHMEIEGA